MAPGNLAGAVLMVGLPGPELDDRTAARLERIAPGGIILFARNLDTPERLVRLVEDLGRVLPAPWLLAVDQEGGRVSRLEPWIGPTPTGARVGAAGADAAFRFGRATGAALSALGFDLDFAPVVDLCTPDVPNGIGDRSFGLDAHRVSHLAGSFLDGLQRSGVAGCLKHFPGLGDTTVDSHVDLPVVSRDRATLEARDLVPYRTLGRRPAAIMVGHAHVPALDPTPGVPASLSPDVVGTLLRRTLGFDGLVVSDDLEMGAVAPLDVDGRAALAAVAAGCDLLPYCADLERAAAAHAALRAAAADSPGFASVLGNAAARVRRAAARWPRARPDVARWTAALAGLEAAAREVDRIADEP